MGKRGRRITPEQVVHERLKERTWQEANRARISDEGRRFELAVSVYEAIAGSGSWKENGMIEATFDAGGNCLLNEMGDEEITKWAESFARMDLDHDQEIE